MPHKFTDTGALWLLCGQGWTSNQESMCVCVCVCM